MNLVAMALGGGLTDVAVSRAPRIRVISTGNELVPAGAAIEPHQVRLSNGPAVIAMLAAVAVPRFAAGNPALSVRSARR